MTRVGVLEVRVQQDRAGRFSTALFERYQRSEKAALVASLAEMYVQGGASLRLQQALACWRSWRRGLDPQGKAIKEELCGHGFSASTISEATARMNDGLKAFAERRLGEPYPDLILDARYERVREGVITSQAVLVAIGVDWEGRRQVLGVEMANRKAGRAGETSWWG